MNRIWFLVLGLLALQPTPAAATPPVHRSGDAIVRATGEFPANVARSGGAMELALAFESSLSGGSTGPRSLRDPSDGAGALREPRPGPGAPGRAIRRGTSSAYRTTLACYPNPPPASRR